MNFKKFFRTILYGVVGLALGLLAWKAYQSITHVSVQHYAPITLTEAESFIHTTPIPQKPENNNLFYPEYVQFYRHQAPSLVDVLWKHVSSSPWHPLHYEALFEAVIKHLEHKNSCPHAVVQLQPQPGDRIIIFGDLQGTFESCVRDLFELKKQGIIDNDLVIKKPHYYVIFNTNVIGREPLNLEMLALVSSMMLKNPDKVWYIRGKYEETGWWKFNPLGQQLEALKSYGVRLSGLIERVISLLPYALYINYEHGKKLIRISGYGRDYELINERMFGTFFETTRTSYCFDNQIRAQTLPHIKATIYSNDGVDEFENNQGLALVDFTGGSIVWSVFSAPTPLQASINDFHYDAFAMLELGSTFEETALHLYNRDVRSKQPFMHQERYVLQTGRPIGLQEKIIPQYNQIMLGSSIDLSKGASVDGRAIKTGLSVGVNAYNRTIKSTQKPLQLIVRDNEYSPAMTRQTIEEFKQDGIDTIIALHGSITLRSIMDYLEDSSLLFLFPVSGARIFRAPRLVGIIHNKASYRDEVFALIPDLIEKQFVRRFAFFYQDDVFGISGMEAAREILPRYGIKEWTEIPYVRNITDMKQIAEKIKQSQPEALGLFSTASATVELIKQLGTDTAMNIKLFGLDTLSESLFVKFAKKNGLRVLLAHTVPDPDTSDLPIVQEYRNAMRNAGKVTGDFSLEGFIDVQLFIHALQNIKGPLDHVALRTFFEQMKKYDFKGLQLNFDPINRSLCDDVWVGDLSGITKRISAPEQAFNKREFNL